MKIESPSSKLSKFYTIFIFTTLHFWGIGGAIYLMPIWVQFVDNKIFDFYFKNFPFRGECHEVTFGTSLTYCLFAAMLLISLPVVFKATGLAYV